MAVEIKKELTYEEYLALPETMQRYEILDGEFVLTPAPTVKHQVVLGNLYRALFDFVSKRGLGLILLSPHDIIVRRKPKLRTRQPDLTYVSKARERILGERIEGGGPDLVIEILSPGDTRKRMQGKLKDYSAIGVRECWLISLEAETVEVLRLSKKSAKRVGLYGAGDIITSDVLIGLQLQTNKIFV